MKSVGHASSLCWAIFAVLLVPLSTFPQPKHAASIKLEQVTETAGLAVRVRAEIKNVSEQPIEVLRGSAVRDFTITVLGPDKKPAKLTEGGERSRSLVPNGSQILTTLPPQQSLSHEWNLSDDFDFSRPGTYRVTVSRKFDSINEIDTSNTIEILRP